MLASIMYHHAGPGEFGNPPRLLDRQFAYLRKRRIRTVWPGETANGGANVCLVFDDATYDFYHSVFPLLVQHNLRAVLAVPTAFIPEHVRCGAAERLRLAVGALARGARPSAGPGFCTWAEINEMLAAARVLPVPHGHSHREARTVDACLADAGQACRVLSDRIGLVPQAFVLPYGKVPAGAAERLSGDLRLHHVFGIGGGKYASWNEAAPVILRFPGDNQPDATSLIDAIFPRRSLRFRLGQLRRRLIRRRGAASRASH